MTRFSRLIRWFEHRQEHFRDHRALFRAAPRYGLALSLAVMAVFASHALNASFWFLLAASVLGDTFVFAATYLFFMTVGSVEYDNEEKARRLEKAYAQLQLYSARIRLDLDRARTVQQNLL